MKPTLFALTIALLLPTWASAVSIGVNFSGGRTGGTGGTGPTDLLAGDLAGVVPQMNFNNVPGGSGTNLNLLSDTGAATTAMLTFTSGGTYTASGGTVPADGDEKLNNGFVFGNGSVTVSNIPYALYDLYIYTLNDAVRLQTTTLLPSSPIYGTSPAPGGAGFLDGSAATPYNYIRATSTDLASPTNPANYVRFSALSGASVSFTTSATGNGFLNGFQVVQVPEPSCAALGIGGLMMVGIRRRK